HCELLARLHNFEHPVKKRVGDRVRQAALGGPARPLIDVETFIPERLRPWLRRHLEIGILEPQTVASLALVDRRRGVHDLPDPGKIGPAFGSSRGSGEQIRLPGVGARNAGRFQANPLRRARCGEGRERKQNQAGLPDLHRTSKSRRILQHLSDGGPERNPRPHENRLRRMRQALSADGVYLFYGSQVRLCETSTSPIFQGSLAPLHAQRAIHKETPTVMTSAVFSCFGFLYTSGFPLHFQNKSAFYWSFRKVASASNGK